jgi:four helix bundle protein
VKKELIKSHEDLAVYQMAFDVAMQIFELSKQFPQEEKYSLTDQMRRSSRSVCTNLAEAWRKRRYEAAFKAKLNDCVPEGGRSLAEAAEHDLEGFSVEKRFNQVQKYYEGIITSRICSVDFPWSNKL